MSLFKYLLFFFLNVFLKCERELEIILAQYHAVQDFPLVPTSNFNREIVVFSFGYMSLSNIS